MAYDSLGEFTWIILYGGLGYLFGSQWELVSDFISNFGGLILGIVILGVGAWLGLRRRRVIENEKVTVVNVNNGERLDTYLIKGKRGSGVCCLNGPAARKGMTGDVVVIITYATMPFEEAKEFRPWIVFPKEGNRL